MLFGAKHSWTALRMSRPLFVGSYLQITWWALGQNEKKEKFALNDNDNDNNMIFIIVITIIILILLNRILVSYLLN